MKRRLYIDLILGAASLGFATGAIAQTEPRIVVPLSDPSRPATLDVSLVNGSISVSAYDGDEIVVVPHEVPSEPGNVPGVRDEFGGRGERAGRRSGDDDAIDRTGLHRIPNTSIGLTAEERDNRVEVSTDWANQRLDLEISVPRRTSVRARTVNGGDLTVVGVTGDHELSNVNGSIAATDIGGSAVVGTRNGNVHVSFTELTGDKPMSFSSFNGDVEVALPEDIGANLRMSTGRGEVLTDFELEVQSQPPVVEHGNDGGRYRVRLERAVTAVVGGGGPELQFKTFNGDIVIRKR